MSEPTEGKPRDFVATALASIADNDPPRRLEDFSLQEVAEIRLLLRHPRQNTFRITEMHMPNDEFSATHISHVTRTTFCHVERCQ